MTKAKPEEIAVIGGCRLELAFSGHPLTLTRQSFFSFTSPADTSEGGNLIVRTHLTLLAPARVRAELLDAWYSYSTRYRYVSLIYKKSRSIRHLEYLDQSSGQTLPQSKNSGINRVQSTFMLFAVILMSQNESAYFGQSGEWVAYIGKSGDRVAFIGQSPVERYREGVAAGIPFVCMTHRIIYESKKWALRSSWIESSDVVPRKHTCVEAASWRLCRRCRHCVPLFSMTRQIGRQRTYAS